VFSTRGSRAVELWTGATGGCPGDTFVTLERWEGPSRHLVSADDDSGEGVCSRIQATLPNFVTDDNGGLFLLGAFKKGSSVFEGMSGTDWLDGYRVRIHEGEQSVEVVQVVERKFFCSTGDGWQGGLQCNFRAATGTYVDPQHRLLFYATEHFDSAETPWVRMKEFRSVARAGEADCPTLGHAWVELYQDANFGGRSIMLDFVDRNKVDLSDLDTIEDFGGRASSARWCIPEGHWLKGWRETGFTGGSCLFEGTGRVAERAHLSSTCGNDALDSVAWRYQ